MKRLYLMLGNGFSIDLINKLKQASKDRKFESVDLLNLFSKGDEVPWPKSKDIGFLSRKYCKALWELGARTTMTSEESIKLIENILTCINVINYGKLIQEQEDDVETLENNNIVEAYNELTSYLRYLMIYYNSLISDEDLKSIEVPLINFIKSNISNYDEYIIITYNYDILLERLLIIHGLDFKIECFEEKDSKIKIFKPHGSISFSFKAQGLLTQTFNISKEQDNFAQSPNDFEIKYDLVNDYPLVVPIIPPAGDSNRVKAGWIKEVREGIANIVSDSTKKDKLVIFGVSYWHVDRLEIDEIITKIDRKTNVIYINPKPDKCFDAVLSSIFKNYIHFKDSKTLGGVI